MTEDEIINLLIELRNTLHINAATRGNTQAAEAIESVAAAIDLVATKLIAKR